jgi:hypothetical protein
LPRAVRLSILLVSYTLSASLAHAQAGGAAAVDGLLSTFAALTGTQTGLGSGRNLGITAGVDLGFQPFHGLYPSLEARGTYPIDKGNVDSQKTLLGGLKLAVPLPFIPRIRPYGTALFGRGSINYGAGYEVPGTPIFYTISHSNVFDLGGGVDLKLSPHLDLKLDAQAQRFSTPVTVSHHLYATTANIGFVYHLLFQHPTNEVLH